MGKVKNFIRQNKRKIGLAVGGLALAGAGAYGLSKLRGRNLQKSHRSSSVVRLRNQVLKLKLKKAKMKAQKELWREQLKI